MEYIPFQSRKGYHKTPYGAVRADECLTFRIVLPRTLQCRGASLLLQKDNTDAPQMHAMTWEGMQGDAEEWWTLTCNVARPGLYWYHFLLHTAAGEERIYHAGGGIGRIGTQQDAWQLTVYDAAFTTPDWLKGGVIYQIFPDRFARSGDKKENIPDDRILRDDWGAAPNWAPNEKGEITRYDFFGGDLSGIRKKLAYLADLGVSCIYLNPIFEAQSNHRYDTADYCSIDPLLGDETDFSALCAEAQRYGIRIVLDGVFSHTGADSRYFNRAGRYPDVGAYQSQTSPYYSWYRFMEWPDRYQSWWGIPILPELQEENENLLAFFAGKDGVARKWLRAGAAGWRLDVADELPDVFLDAFRTACKQEKPDAYVLGEVWEDASNKVSYGQRRRYLLGDQLDSVMNYPFADAILRFAKDGQTDGFFDVIETVLEHYPQPAIHTLMNHIGTHDTLRALTHLGGAQPVSADSRQFRELDVQQRTIACKRLCLASVLQFTLPGVPCIYYGDEAGLQGGRDPFNRACFPWDDEDAALQKHYRALGKIRRTHSVFRTGGFFPRSAAQGCIAYVRGDANEQVFVIANWNPHAIIYQLPEEWQQAQCIYPVEGARVQDGAIAVDACTGIILERIGPPREGPCPDFLR